MSLRRSRGGSRPRNFLRVCLALVARRARLRATASASRPWHKENMRRRVLLTLAVTSLLSLLASPRALFTEAGVVSEARTKRGARGVGKYQYPFQNPALPAEERI